MKLLAALAAIARLFERLLDWLDEAKAERKREERREKHDQIDADTDAAVSDRWRLHDAGVPGDGEGPRREDGAPLDYDVSGPSGTLRDESPDRLPRG